MATMQEPYLKAAGSDRFAPYYDAMARLGMRERHVKGRVIDLAGLAPGRRMLDLGCGTGTLVLLARRRYPSATVLGIDGDPTILAIARRKARHAGIPVRLDEGMAYALPYADGSFDMVVSTLTFHHLTPDQQGRALAEVRRVLRPGGRLAIADLAPPHNRLMRLVQGQLAGILRGHGRPGAPQPEHQAASAARRDGDERPVTASDGRRGGTTTLEWLLTTNGWRRLAPIERFMSAHGTIALYALMRPGEAGPARANPTPDPRRAP